MALQYSGWVIDLDVRTFHYSQLRPNFRSGSTVDLHITDIQDVLNALDGSDIVHIARFDIVGLEQGVLRYFNVTSIGLTFFVDL